MGTHLRYVAFGALLVASSVWAKTAHIGGAELEEPSPRSATSRKVISIGQGQGSYIDLGSYRRNETAAGGAKKSAEKGTLGSIFESLTAANKPAEVPKFEPVKFEKSEPLAASPAPTAANQQQGMGGTGGAGGAPTDKEPGAPQADPNATAAAQAAARRADAATQRLENAQNRQLFALLDQRILRGEAAAAVLAGRELESFKKLVGGLQSGVAVSDETVREVTRSMVALNALGYSGDAARELGAAITNNPELGNALRNSREFQQIQNRAIRGAVPQEPPAASPEPSPSPSTPRRDLVA